MAHYCQGLEPASTNVTSTVSFILQLGCLLHVAELVNQLSRRGPSAAETIISIATVFNQRKWFCAEAHLRKEK